MNNTIMIVDDMQLNIDLLAQNLDDKYIIMPATSGENAIRLLKRRKPDLVLLDVSMPGIDGYGVLKFMKENKDLANIPVIFVTGEHDSDAEEKGLALGAVDYVKKPFNPTIIGIKVQNQLELKSYRDSLEYLVQDRTQQLEASREAIIMGMSLMSEIHDNVTGEHIERIKVFTRILVSKILELYPMLITPELAVQIALYSPLHDVGKVGISDTILKKKGALTTEEFEIMKTHTIKGAELLRRTEHFLTNGKTGGNSLKVAIEIAESHHEKYDGTGYPHGLKADDIPLSARIVAIADVYEALRGLRQYKKPFSHKEAMDIILTDPNSRGHFDPIVLSAFVEVQEKFSRVC